MLQRNFTFYPQLEQSGIYLSELVLQMPDRCAGRHSTASRPEKNPSTCKSAEACWRSTDQQADLTETIRLLAAARPQLAVKLHDWEPDPSFRSSFPPGQVLLARERAKTAQHASDYSCKAYVRECEALLAACSPGQASLKSFCLGTEGKLNNKVVWSRLSRVNLEVHNPALRFPSCTSVWRSCIQYTCVSMLTQAYCTIPYNVATDVIIELLP